MSIEAWKEAHREAARRGLPSVSNELLLLGLARSGGLASEALAALGATADAVSGAIPAPTFGDSQHTASPRDAREVSEALARADGIALGLCRSRTSAHLLLALAYDSFGSHVAVLRTLGIEQRAIVEWLRTRGEPVPSRNPLPHPPSRRVVRVVLPREQARLVIQELDRRLAAEPLETSINENGIGRWGYGAVHDQPDHTKIVAEIDFGLPEIVESTLRAEGLEPPPANAWDITDI
jgi:ClpA/ClpB-like protein